MTIERFLKLQHHNGTIGEGYYMKGVPDYRFPRNTGDDYIVAVKSSISHKLVDSADINGFVLEVVQRDGLANMIIISVSKKG